jgi:hypothetical protein
MKLFASVFLSIALCGVASAAPLSINSSEETHKAMASEIIGATETGNIHGTSSAGGRHDTPPPVEVIPEPASMALLGIGLGLAALRRRRS